MEAVRIRAPDLAAASDAELVSRSCRGEGAAFAAIMQRYNRRLYRVARGILRDDAEAEDALQEAYLRAYGALHLFRGEAGLATWLTRIVMNEALGRSRRRRPTEELSVLERGENGGGCVIRFPGLTGAADPEATAARSEVRRLLESAVDELPDPFRMVFVMREIEEMTTEETAGQLGIRPETVKTRLHRARMLLRRSLDAKLASTLRDTFPFDGARCGRMTEAVLDRLGLAGGDNPAA